MRTDNPNVGPKWRVTKSLFDLLFLEVGIRLRGQGVGNEHIAEGVVQDEGKRRCAGDHLEIGGERK